MHELPGRLTLLANGRPYVSVSELSLACKRLHAELRTAAAGVPEHHLHDEFSEHRRTLAEQLGHLAEHHQHLARQLHEWIHGQRLVLGRPGEQDADLADGLLRATRARLQDLQQHLAASTSMLESVLAELDDEHLRTTVHNIASGREPLASFLTRRTLEHGRLHLQELRDTSIGLTPGGAT